MLDFPHDPSGNQESQAHEVQKRGGRENTAVHNISTVPPCAVGNREQATDGKKDCQKNHRETLFILPPKESMQAVGAW